MNKKNIIVSLVALLLVVLICVVPLMTVKDSEFGGADGKAMDLITEIDPNYEPWFESVITLPGGETESLLFALQAAVGSGVFFYFLGYLVGSKKKKED